MVSVLPERKCIIGTTILNSDSYTEKQLLTEAILINKSHLEDFLIPNIFISLKQMGYIQGRRKEIKA